MDRLELLGVRESLSKLVRLYHIYISSDRCATKGHAAYGGRRLTLRQNQITFFFLDFDF